MNHKRINNFIQGVCKPMSSKHARGGILHKSIITIWVYESLEGASLEYRILCASVPCVTPCCVNACPQTSLHWRRQTSNDVIWNAVPFLYECLLQLLPVLWNLLPTSDLPVQVIPQMLDRVHIRRARWPGQDVNIVLLQKVVSLS